MNVSSVSVIICTYNRAALLHDTLSTLQAMNVPRDCQVEIVIVDNNSSDNTPLVIAEAAAASRFPIVALKEIQQGKSFALNVALARASGDVLALSDDDVRPAADWLERIVDDFRRHDVKFVFGKVLPRWARTPPPELLTLAAQAIWGPLAIVDYGDAPARYQPDAPGQRLPIGANLAFARTTLITIGGWRTDLGKVNNTLLSGEDHEIFFRMRRFGFYAGYYDPRVVVRHYVPPERLTRRYFRRWFFWNGKTEALMLDDLYAELDMRRVPRVAGIPRFALRQALYQTWRWIVACLRRDALTALIEELRLVKYAGLFVQCWQLWRQRRRAPLTALKHTRCGAGLAGESR